MNTPAHALLLLAMLAAAALPAPADEAAPADPFDPSWKRAFDPPDDSWKKAKQELVFNNGAEPETLDPHPMTGVTEHTLALALYEGLVTHDPETLKPRPGVAERWELSEDGRTYTFRLRKNAKWSNGAPLGAEDFQWSFFRALLPATLTDYAYLFFYIEGAKEFYDGKAEGGFDGFRKRVRVEAPDATTLRITLKAPTAYFLDLCAFETYMPVHRATVERHGTDWTRPEHWVGNGAFLLAEWKPRQRIVMTPNPHYWDAGYVKLQKIVALPIEDNDQAHNMFLKGECDWTKTIPLPKIDEAVRNPDYFVMPYLGSYFYRVNVTQPHLADKRIRQALSLAIHREALVRDVTKAGEIPAAWFCPAVAGYEPPKGWAYDPDRARALLAEAGYPGGKGYPTLTLLYNTQDTHKTIAERIAQYWRETLGITVSLRNTEWKVYLRQVELLDYDIARAGWIGDYTDPNSFLDMWLKDGGNNNTGWDDPRYDELIAAAAVERDEAKRFELFRTAERMLVEDQFPILPIYIYVNKGMKRDTLRGWYENIRDLHPFQYMYYEP
ncbi:MAG: peptide ABC transporter substrate-binding protein [Planctomycetaceae bacterium]